MRHTLLITVALLLVTAPATAQEIDAEKGEPFTLMLPWSSLYPDGQCMSCNGWGADPISVYAADIQPDQDLPGEFPALLELSFEKAKNEKQYVEAELRNRSMVVKLRFYDRVSAQTEFGRVASRGGV